VFEHNDKTKRYSKEDKRDMTKTNMINQIIPKHYYVIKVAARLNSSKYRWFKVGEADAQSRPNGLVKKFVKKSSTREVDANTVLWEELPHSTKARLTDHKLHEYLIKNNIVKSLDANWVEHVIDEKDGSNEVFELVDPNMTDEEFLDIVKATVAAIKKSEYTGRLVYDQQLVYDPTKKHLVAGSFFNRLMNKFPDIFARLYNPVCNPLSVLLIGQIEPEFVSTIAIYNKVYIWHDTADATHTYALDRINQNITYITNLKEIIEMDIKFDLIIENPPYGSTGNTILKNIIENVDFEDHICLIPLKDLTVETGNHVDFNTINTFAPHSFTDADVLTHAFRVSKNKINDTKTIEELCALAFTVDKPFIKFMKANELRNHYAISNIHSWKPADEISKTFVFHGLAMNSQHTCGLASSASVTFANAYNLSNIEIKEKTQRYTGFLTSNACRSICFNTPEEKQNFVEFYKKNRNFLNRMIANQFIGIRDHGECFPKVDWTKSDWTVEKILKEVANYTDDENKTVLDTMTKDYAVKKDSCIERLFKEYL
jgi:hypothetical protein